MNEIGGKPVSAAKYVKRAGRSEFASAELAGLLEVYGAQLGEMSWHAMHVDPTLDSMSAQHAASIVRVARQFGAVPSDRPVRILEMGAYAHNSAQRAAHELNGISVSHDISPSSLILAARNAQKDGFVCEHHQVAGDFHDMPFSSGYFDVVFIASAVHHTWRPWDVMREALRVVRPGGIFRCENEPIGRKACFYQFRCNRHDRFTAFEQAIEDKGLTYTYSSPFPGSRAEELFGMIENDRIPLDMYVSPALEVGEIVESDLDSAVLVGDFGQWLLGLDRGASLPQTIAARMLADARDLARHFTLEDDLSGYSVPNDDQIWKLSYEIAAGLRRIPEGATSGEEIADLFGSALRMTIRKTTGEASDVMFRRTLPVENGVLIDPPRDVTPSIVLKDVLPSLDGDAEDLAKVYPSADWLIYKEENGYHSALVLNQSATIQLPDTGRRGILLVRMYSVKAERPYDLEIWQGGELAYRHTVFGNESHMARVLVRSGEQVVIQTREVTGERVAWSMHTRIGACKLFLVDSE